MKRILLDRECDAICPKGYLRIESEVNFLEHALSVQSLIICGDRLCDWAAIFFNGRQIEFAEVLSPVTILRGLYPELTMGQAQFICKMLGDDFVVSNENLNHQNLLSEIYPHKLWFERPSIKHAAEWLLWLDEKEPDPAFYPILAGISNNWKHDCPEMSIVYEASQTEKARETLRLWLGIENLVLPKKYGGFPLRVPDKWKELALSAWRKEMIKSNGQYLGQLVNANLPRELRQLAAFEALGYFESNPTYLTKKLQNYIARFISGQDRDRLNLIAHAIEPGSVPHEPESVFRWFLKEYSPYREWQSISKNKQAQLRVLELGKEFAEWYLDYYPVALNSKKHLSFYRTQSIQNDPDYVSLLMVLDGLHLYDAQIINQILLNTKGSNHLSMLENSLCFAPIPTVTDFAKGALIRGGQPSLIKELSILGEDISERDTPVDRLQTAHKGALFIWRIQDPDHTYHSRNKYKTLKTDVQGQLKTIAQKIIEISDSVNSTIPLRIIITTDHGRILSESKRYIEVPNGLEAHGRAAWGQTNIMFDAKGYMIDQENDIVFLSKHRFGLSDDAAVILSDLAFKTGDGKQKSEFFPHGGLFPEEVIIPWIVFERNVPKPDIEITVSGEGQTNRPAALSILVTNSSRINLTIKEVEVNFGIDKVTIHSVEQLINKYKTEEINFEIASWPSSEQKMSGQLHVIIRLPDGDEIEYLPTLEEVKITEIYTRDKSFLEGLDLP